MFLGYYIFGIAIYYEIRKNTGAYPSDLAVISLRRLGEEYLVVSKLLLVGERNAINTLERIVIRVAKEVRGGALFSDGCVVMANVVNGH